MSGGCQHLRNLRLEDFRPTRTQEGCEECLAKGTRWVALRECLACGHVGCCDSSPGNHATAHYQNTQHPVMRSIMPGESWDWCYVHHISGELH